MQRKIIQLEETNNCTLALCDDGSVFKLTHTDNRPLAYEYRWVELPAIPQKAFERSFIGQVTDKLSDAYQEGYTAGYNSQPKTLNLYHPTTQEFSQWEKGYIAAVKA